MGLSLTTDAGDAALMAAGAPGLTTPRLDLFTAISPDLSKSSVWADFTIPVFTGYAGPVTVTVSAAYISSETGLLSVDISDAVFNGPSAGAGVDVVGWVLHDTTGTPVVYAAGMFDGPLSLQEALDRVTVDEKLGMGITVNFFADN